MRSTAAPFQKPVPGQKPVRGGTSQQVGKHSDFLWSRSQSPFLFPKFQPWTKAGFETDIGIALLWITRTEKQPLPCKWLCGHGYWAHGENNALGREKAVAQNHCAGQEPTFPPLTPGERGLGGGALIVLNYNIHIQSAKTRPGADSGSDHELLIAKFRLKLKKVG